MRLLLDTQTWLWIHLSPNRFSPQVRATLADIDNERYLSIASMWEIVIKFAGGKLTLPDHPSAYIAARMESAQTTPLAIEMAHVFDIATLPGHHRDPFDRVLISQARVEGLTVVTADPVFSKYEVEVLQAE